MTWGNNSIFQILIIQGSQAITGLFLYNGLGAPGNPPQIAMVASGVTTDPFGNAITSSKILMQANVITLSGGIIRTAGTAPLLQLDGPHNAFLAYDAAAVLRETIAPAVTSDGLGNTVQSGFTSYGSVNTTWVRMFQQLIVFNMAGDAINPSIGENAGAQLQLESGTTAALGQFSTVNLKPSAASPALVEVANAGLMIDEVAAPAANAGGPQLFGNTSGHVHVISDSTNGDSQNYSIERVRQVTTGTQSFTLAAATAITGLSRAMGVGTYHVRLKVFWVPSGVVGSTHVHAFAFTGTATASLNGQCWQAQAASAVQQTALNGGTLASTLTSPTHVAFAGWTELDLQIVVTVAGTLTTTVALTTAGDGITSSAGTYWEITPES